MAGRTAERTPNFSEVIEDTDSFLRLHGRLAVANSVLVQDVTKRLEFSDALLGEEFEKDNSQEAENN